MRKLIVCLSSMETYLDGLDIPESCQGTCWELSKGAFFLHGFDYRYLFEPFDSDDKSVENIRAFPVLSLRNKFDLFSGEQYMGEVSLGGLFVRSGIISVSSYVHCSIEILELG
jgi:hypothetical protein